MNPQERITAYLFANKARLQFSTMDLVIADVKFSVLALELLVYSSGSNLLIGRRGNRAVAGRV